MQCQPALFFRECKVSYAEPRVRHVHRWSTPGPLALACSAVATWSKLTESKLLGLQSACPPATTGRDRRLQTRSTNSHIAPRTSSRQRSFSHLFQRTVALAFFLEETPTPYFCPRQGPTALPVGREVGGSRHLPNLQMQPPQRGRTGAPTRGWPKSAPRPQVKQTERSAEPSEGTAEHNAAEDWSARMPRA